MKKNKLFIYAISGILGVSLSFYVNNNLLSLKNTVTSDKDVVKKLKEVKTKHYLSNSQTNELMINSLFAHINRKDPHSMYFNKKMYKEFNTGLNSTLVGIGVLAQQKDQQLIIKRIFKNTPASESSLKEDDIITKVDGVDFKSLPKNKILTDLIKGNENTTAHLTIIRDGSEQSIDVQRRSIQLDQISTKDINGNFYLKIDSFGDNLDKSFEKHVEKINKSKKLIIDLRDNSGGELVEVEKIISHFVKKNTLILQRKVNSKTNKNYSVDVKGRIKVPVVVLVNENSASASEILALDLRELYNAKLIGVKTYGKGSVQQLIPLSDGTAYKFTIERWFSAKGTGIDHKGIKPDIEIKDNDFSNYSYEKGFEKDKVLHKAMEE